MKIRVLTTTTLFALLAAPAWAQPQETGTAQEAATTQDLPDARTVIDRYLEVTGADKAINDSTSTRTKGTMEVVGMGLSGPMEILSHKSNKVAVQIEMGAMGLVRQGYDGDTAWSIHPMMGATIQEGPERLQTVMQANYAGALKRPQDYEKVETVAKKNFQGKDCWKIEVVAKTPDGADAAKTKTVRTVHEYYDVETGLLAGQESIAASPMGEMRIVTILSDYKQMGPRLQPTTALQKMGGQDIKITTESVVYDDVEETAFALPKEIQVQVDAKK